MFCQTALAPHERRRDHARRRSGLHRHGRHAQAFAHAEDAAARAHHPRRRQSHAGDGRLEAAEVGRKDRPHVRAHGRGAGALELADLRQHLARQEDRHVGERRPQRPPDRPLVGVVEEREQQTDGDGVDPMPPDELDRRADVLGVELLYHAPLGVDALADFQSQVTRHQHGRGVLEEIVEARAGRAPQLEHVATAVRGDQGDPGAAPLQQRVGDHGGRMGQPADVTGGHPVRGRRRTQAGHHALGEIPRSRRHLDHVHGAGRLVGEHDVGERAADVHADAPRHGKSSITARGARWAGPRRLR